MEIVFIKNYKALYEVLSHSSVSELARSKFTGPPPTDTRRE